MLASRSAGLTGPWPVRNTVHWPSRAACSRESVTPHYWLGPGPRLRYGPAMEDADGYFPERVAATYDDSSEGLFDPAFTDTVTDLLAGLAGGGRALELGIGTGRIALPLARRGVEVHGIDLSRAMVARLRAKPGGDAIPVVIGDFATVTLDGTFSLVYLVFNTINNLT